MREATKAILQEGAFSRWVRDSAAFSAALEIDVALGLDRDFPGPRNIFDELLRLLPQLESSERQRAWIAALHDAEAAQAQQADEHWIRLAQTARDGNPLGGRFGLYPVAALLLQPATSALDKRRDVLHHLFLSALLTQPNKTRGEQATQLRQALTARATEQHSLIMRMPALSEPDYRHLLGTFLEAPGGDALSARQQELLDTLRNLYRDWTVGSPVRLEPVVKSPDRVVPPVLDTLSETPAPGHLDVRELAPGDSATGEHPDRLELFVAADADGDAPPPSEQEIEVSARESRYWSVRLQRLVPGDASRLTSIEQRRVARLLTQWMQANDNDRGLAAGLLALTYVTGLGLDGVLRAPVGAEGTFGPEGAYRRAIRQPPDAFVPGEDVHAALEPRAQQLVLTLPTPVSSWLQLRCNGTDGALMDVLGLDEGQARKHVSAALDELRDNGRFQRIRLARVEAALPQELTLAYRDPTVTHLLSGREAHVAPVLAYYVVHSYGELAKCYSQTTERMMASA